MFVVIFVTTAAGQVAPSATLIDRFVVAASLSAIVSVLVSLLFVFAMAMAALDIENAPFEEE